MILEDSQRLSASLQEAAKIFDRNTPSEEMANFKSLEKAVRTKVCLASQSKNRFFSNMSQGKIRQRKSRKDHCG